MTVSYATELTVTHTKSGLCHQNQHEKENDLFDPLQSGRGSGCEGAQSGSEALDLSKSNQSFI